MHATPADDRQTHRHRLKFHWLPGVFAITRLVPDAPLPDWAIKGEFSSITRTADELSIVCSADNVPANLRPAQRWICLKLGGPFALAQTGILLSFIEPLSSNRIPIFTLSTYDTDYVLIPEEFAGASMECLQQSGHELWPRPNPGSS